MILHIGTFLLITLCVGFVNLILSEPLERSLAREISSFLTVVVGGISLFTAAIVVVSILFQ